MHLACMTGLARRMNLFIPLKCKGAAAWFEDGMPRRRLAYTAALRAIPSSAETGERVCRPVEPTTPPTGAVQQEEGHPVLSRPLTSTCCSPGKPAAKHRFLSPLSRGRSWNAHSETQIPSRSPSQPSASGCLGSHRGVSLGESQDGPEEEPKSDRQVARPGNKFEQRRVAVVTEESGDQFAAA
jgi:hypothetical protein